MTNAGKKATNAEISERLKIMYEMLVKGYSRADIIRYFQDKYNITENNVDRYIKQTYSIIARNNAEEMEKMRAMATTRYLRWMVQAEKEGGIELASKMQARIDKINGLEVIIKKVDHTHSLEHDSNLIADLLNGS